MSNKLKITVNNGPFEDVELVSGDLRQGTQIVVDRDGVRTAFLINSCITDDQPDLAICTLLHVLPDAPAVAAPSETPAVPVAPPAV